MSKRAENCEVVLIGPIGPKLKKLLNKNIKISTSSLIEKDEIHLILEYNANQLFESLQTPTANRFIVSHDAYNSRMEMLDEFFEFAQSHQPDIIILTGLHLLESQSDTFR